MTDTITVMDVRDQAAYELHVARGILTDGYHCRSRANLLAIAVSNSACIGKLKQSGATPHRRKTALQSLTTRLLRQESRRYS